MNRRNFTTAGSLFLTGLLGASKKSFSGARPLSAPPNIVLILTDDLGFSDLGCYGSEIDTPNLDQLAADGVRFRQFYNAARGCASQASLLTGLYPHQAGMGWTTAADMGHKGYQGDLNQNCVTLAETLGTRGYRSYMTGKWHVSAVKNNDGSNKHNWPIQRGFNRFFGNFKSYTSYVQPRGLTLDNESIKPGDDFYYTDETSNYACKFISEHMKETPATPFFSFVSFYGPHWPIQAKPNDIEKYMGKYDIGWDAIRQQRFERMKKMGVISTDCPLSERDGATPAWDSISDEEKKNFSKRMAIYAAQIDCVDQGVGRIIKTLKEKGVFDNTLILFVSDNGGTDASFIGRNTTYENMGTNGGGGTCFSHWSNVSNTPFRKFKTWTHEGGISSPFIAHWPKQIKRTGVFSDQVGHIMDVMATVVDLSGTDYPTVYNGNEIHPREGISLKNALLKGTTERRELFFEHQGRRAIRQDDWKLVALDLDQPWELYNLAKDRSETVNLVDAYPDKVKELIALWDEHAKRIPVDPLNGMEWVPRMMSLKDDQIN